MRDLGILNGVNLDGGGSATMWIAGRGVVNDPSDSDGERPVSNAVVVLPGADPNEVVPRAKSRRGPGWTASAPARSISHPIHQEGTWRRRRS